MRTSLGECKFTLILYIACLIKIRIKKHQLQMNKLNDLIQKRSTIEAKLFASSQNIESAFIYADKALAFAFGRRLQSIGKHLVRFQNFIAIPVEADVFLRCPIHNHKTFLKSVVTDTDDDGATFLICENFEHVQRYSLCNSFCCLSSFRCIASWLYHTM